MRPACRRAAKNLVGCCDMKSALRVLVVEDHLPTLQALCICLADYGHQVIPVASMSAAMNVARNTTFDALVCDIALPDGDGWQLLARLREKRPVPAVAISGLTGAREKRHSFEAGFDQYLEKPFSPAALATAISNAAGDC